MGNQPHEISQTAPIDPRGYTILDRFTQLDGIPATSREKLIVDELIRNGQLLETELATAKLENARLNGLINIPHTDDWLEAVPLEAAHQIARWGTENDDGKDATDWMWLIGYLTGKAVHAQHAGDLEKAKHHTISSAAVLLNWHRRLSGTDMSMRPGIEEPKG